MIQIRKYKNFLITLFVVSFVIRLGALLFYFQYNPCMTMYDSSHYHGLAQSLVQGLGYVGADSAPYFYRLPGYPIFLALCYFFVGVKPVVALAVQCILASCIPVLIFVLTQTFFSTSLLVAQVTALISCFHVGYIIYANLLMAETCFLIFFLLFLICFFNKRFIYAGLLLGVASLIRPVGHFVLLVAWIVLLFECFLSRRENKVVLNCVKIFFSWLVTVSPWLIRNFFLTGMIFFHTLSGPHFINHSAIRLAQAHNNLSYEQAKKQVYHDVDQAIFEREKKVGRSLNQAEESCVMEQVARSYITKNIWQTMKHGAINVFKTAFSLYSSELLVIEQEGALPEYDESRSFVSMIKRFLFPEVKHKVVWLVIYYELIFWLIILFGCVGFCMQAFFCRLWLASLVKVMPFILLFLILSCACGFARLRLPIEHFLIVVAIVFWISLLENKVRLD